MMSWTDNFILRFNLIFLAIMIAISFGYWDGFYWQKNGYEKMVLDKDLNFFYLKKSLINWFLRRGKVSNNRICIYDKKIDPNDPAPKSDGFVGSYGGKIIIWYYPTSKNKTANLIKMPQFFRFGKSLTSEDAELIVEKVKQFWL